MCVEIPAGEVEQADIQAADEEEVHHTQAHFTSKPNSMFGEGAPTPCDGFDGL